MEGTNLLYICDYAATYTGNFIASLAALAEKAQKKNMSVWFLFPEAARGQSWLHSLPVDDSSIFFCDFSVKALASLCKNLAVRLRSERTIVHTHFVGDFRLLAIRLSFSRVICHYHMTVPVCFNFMKKIKRLVRCVIYRGLILIGVSQAVTDDLKVYFGSPVCECIPNAIDFQMLEKCSEGTSLSDSFQGTGRFRILMHGTDSLRKGVDLAALAVAQLNQAHPDAYDLFVTCHGVDEAKTVVDAVTPGHPNVHVVPPVENIKKVYDSMDLFISPSREEAFGYAVVEAAYSRCQVAASDIPGQNTMKSVPGIAWFKADDVDALKQAILDAGSNDTAVAEVKARQQAFVTRVFGLEEWVQRNLEVYEKYFGF